MLKRFWKKTVSIICIISMIVIPTGPVYAADNGKTVSELETKVYLEPVNNGPFAFGGDYAAAVALSQNDYESEDFSCTFDVSEVDSEAVLIYAIRYADDDHYAAIIYQNEKWTYEYKNGNNSGYYDLPETFPLVYSNHTVTINGTYNQDGLNFTVNNETMDYALTETITENDFVTECKKPGKAGFGAGSMMKQGGTDPKLYIRNFSVGTDSFSAKDFLNMKWHGKAPVTHIENVPVNQENFPDQGLRNVLLNDKNVRSNVKYDTNSDGILSYDELMGIDGLMARGKNINTAEGIDFLFNADTINLSENNLEEFKSDNKNLKVLYLTNNNLTTVDISGLAGLEKLNCSYNNLSTLDISANKKLKSVSANHNNIKTVYKINNPDLKKLFYIPSRIEMDVNKDFDLNKVPTFIDYINYLYSLPEGYKPMISENGLVYDNTNQKVSLIDGSTEGKLTFSNDKTSETFIFFINEEGVEINEANFPDSEFREYVKNFDENGSKVLTEDEISKVENIDVRGMEINTLEGINLFKNLKKLDADETKIKELDLTGLNNLLEVGCMETGLENIILPASDKLVNLDVSYNLLESIDLSKVVNLKELDCYNNKLKGLDISKNKNLIYLDAENNAFTEINISNRDNLKYLALGKLKKVELSNLPALKTLILAESNIDNIDFGDFPNLHDLVCHHCNLEKLDVTGNTKLEALICFNNKLEELDISKNKDLHQLDCAGNRLTDLDITNNKALTRLNIEGNYIKDASKFKHIKNLNLLQKNTELKSRTGNSANDIPGFWSLYDLKKYGDDIRLNHIIVNEKDKTISLEDGYDAGTMKLYIEGDEMISFNFYYGEPDINAGLSSAFTKVNNSTYKIRANGKHVIAAPVVKDKNGKTLVKDKDYFVKYSKASRVNPGKYTFTVYGLGNHYGEVTKTLIVTPKPVTNVKVRYCLGNSGANDAYLTWSKSPYATGYQVYARRPSKSKTWTSLGTTKNLNFTKRNLYKGYVYEFKVIPYYTSGIMYRSTAGYKTVSLRMLGNINMPVVTKYSKGKVKVSWNNILGESGYQISRASGKAGTYIVSTIPTTTGKYKILTSPKGTRYFKVRAYKNVVVNGKTQRAYTDWSTVRMHRLV